MEKRSRPTPGRFVLEELNTKFVSTVQTWGKKKKKNCRSNDRVKLKIFSEITPGGDSSFESTVFLCCDEWKQLLKRPTERPCPQRGLWQTGPSEESAQPVLSPVAVSRRSETPLWKGCSRVAGHTPLLASNTTDFAVFPQAAVKPFSQSRLESSRQTWNPTVW